MKYLVSHQSQQSGPFSIDEIVAQVRAKELDLFDYIYDLEKDDWVLLMEFAPLAAKLKNNKPARPPQVGTGTTKATAPVVAQPVEAASVEAAPVEVTPKAADPVAAPTVLAAEAPQVSFNVTAHTITEWFVLKGEHRFGPFAYTDLVKMLQQKVVFPFDFVWHTAMDGWKRVAEVPDFTPENIRQLFTKNEGAAQEVFVQRRFPRTKYSNRVIIHDGLSLWKGEGIEISKGGVGVTMQNAKVLPGQQLTLHFTQAEDWPAFNALCEVVSKKFVNDSSPVEYGLRFLSMSQETQDELYKKVA